VAADQGDRDFSAPLAVPGVGLDPRLGAVGPPPSGASALALGVRGVLPAVAAYGWGHARRVSEVPGSGRRTDVPRESAAPPPGRRAGQPAWHCRQTSIWSPLRPFEFPIPGLPVTCMHFLAGFQIQADYKQIHHDGHLPRQANVSWQR
jgi:hypothetical protein